MSDGLDAVYPTVDTSEAVDASHVTVVTVTY